VDVNEAIGNIGDTLLIRSVRYFAEPNLAVIRLLLKHGARINTTNNNHRTVLDALLQQQYFSSLDDLRTEHTRKQALLLLLQHGADVVKTWKPETPIRKFYWDVRSFLVLVNTNPILPVDLLRFLHTFIIG
jgi:hypothetical protein